MPDLVWWRALPKDRDSEVIHISNRIVNTCSQRYIMVPTGNDSTQESICRCLQRMLILYFRKSSFAKGRAMSAAVQGEIGVRVMSLSRLLPKRETDLYILVFWRAFRMRHLDDTSSDKHSLFSPDFSLYPPSLFPMQDTWSTSLSTNRRNSSTRTTQNVITAI